MNRRSRVRFRTDLTVKVACLDTGKTLSGRLANLSAHGLSLILDSPLDPGSVVTVEWGTTRFSGESVYCRLEGEEFLVGIKVEAPVYDTAKSSQKRNPSRAEYPERPGQA